MAFNGYLEVGGVEIINVERTEAYIRHQLPAHPFRNPNKERTLRAALGDEPYESPLIDGAEWVAEADAATHGFFGLYPTEIQGIGDSTLAADVIQSLGEGGASDIPRDGTRSVRVKGLLLGADALSAQAGLAWLRQAIRSDDCGEHGSSCGVADMRFFLAEPNVCDPLFTSAINSVQRFELGDVTPTSSPLIAPFPGIVDPRMPMTARWELTPDDGAIARWGILEERGRRELSTTEPILLRRTNYVRNPRLNGTEGYVVGAGTTVDQLSGVDSATIIDNQNGLLTVSGPFVVDNGDGTYTVSEPPAQRSADGMTFSLVGEPAGARVRMTTPPVIETNWLAGTSFETEADVANWRTNDPEGVRSVIVAGVPDGERAARVRPVAGGVYIETTVLGPLDPIASTFVVSVLHTTERVTVESRDNFGRVVDSTILPATQRETWARHAVQLRAGRGYTIRISTPGEEGITLDAAILSPGSIVPTYFNGSKPAAGGTVYYFAGDPATSESHARRGELAQTSISTEVLDTPFMASTASFDLASEFGARVLVEIRSADDDTVLATATFLPTQARQRYAISATYGRRCYLRFVGDGNEFDLHSIMVEAGAEVHSYFDGDSEPGRDYLVAWSGERGRSVSTWLYVGSTSMKRRDSRWRPFLAVTQSTTAATLAVDLLEQVPVSDQLYPFERGYHRVSAIGGPTVLKEYKLPVGGMIEVEFYLNVGLPHAYSTGREVDTTDPLHIPWDDGDTPAPADPPQLIDPDVPALPVPPRPPRIPEVGYNDDVKTWQRYLIRVPKEDVALWASTVPTLTLTTKGSAVRTVRVRFTPNPFGYELDEVDPLSYCAEFIITYLPPNTALTVNGITRRAFAEIAGGSPVDAGHLLFGTGGVPITWPELTCGIEYVLSIDVAPSTTLDALDVDLVVNRRE